MKKIISLILAAMVILSVASVSVSAAKFISPVEVIATAPVTGSIAKRSVTLSGNPTDYKVVNVLWQDVDENRILAEDETFKAGHVYLLGISLSALNGKVFSEERTTLTVNGSKTDWWVDGGTDGVGTTAIIYHTFPKTTVGYVTNLPISGVAVPVAGATPDWDVSCDWDGAKITAMGWQCVENNSTVYSYSDQSAKDGFVFKAGYTYKVAFALEIKDGYELYSYFTASVNGQYGNGTWNVQNKSVVVEYTFSTTEGSQTHTVSGIVTTFGSNEDEVTVQLCPAGYVEPAYEDRAYGFYTAFNMSDVADGEYTITAYKKNHKAYVGGVIVGGSDVTDMFIVLTLSGDANTDRTVNLSDVTTMLKHIAKWEVEINTYAVDVNNDGMINLTDVTQMLKFIAKWDVELY